MASEKTTKLELNVWKPTDNVSMAEFNENFQKIDSGIGEVAQQLAQTADETSDNTRKITEVNAVKLVPNDERPLSIPTYDGSNQSTHPDALYFPNGWNGYKYWLCHTPYPYSNIKLENPSIVASNDLKVWFEPSTNPVAPLESTAEDAYNSDGNIFMVGDTMELWYRLFENGKVKFYRKTTTDGVIWSENEFLFDQDSFELVRSQSVRYINGKYCMWYNFGSGGGSGTYYNKYAESVDGKIWTNVRKLNIELDNEYYWWHPSVIVTDKGYELISHCLKKDGSGSSIFYSRSIDNVNFPKAIKIIDCSNDVTRIDHRLYRASLVIVDNKYYVFYGTTSANREFRIALTKGISPYELVSDTISKPSTLVLDNNTFKPDNLISEYPNNAITYTRVTGSDSALWPEGKSGTVITDRVTAIPKQIYRMNGGGEYTRYVNQSGAWLPFSSSATANQRIIISGDNAFTPSDSITNFPNQAITYTRITGESVSLMPEGKSGTLITDRVTAIPKQIYRINGGGEYERYANQSGAWLDFHKRPIFIETQISTTDSIVPPSNTLKLVTSYVGLTYNDKIIANPMSPLPQGIIFMATAQSGSVALTFVNITDTNITMPARDWSITIIK